MKYVEFINDLIKNEVLKAEIIVLFGQNINAGSCLSGLTKNLKVRENGLIINTPNSENTLCGVGFGLMLNKVSSVFFMKQQDFLLLGTDHLVNTYNFIRRNNPLASFTIFTTVIDEGYQGLQSSYNNFGDFCSLARIPGFTITNKHDAEQIIRSELVSPGFRIIGVSKRLFEKEILEFKDIVYSNKENSIFQYTEGNDATIVCFNFSFPYGLELYNKLKENGIVGSLFTINVVTPIEWDKIIKNAKATKNLIIIDDSKSENLSCYKLIADITSECRLNNEIILKRDFSDNVWLTPNSEELKINYREIVDKILSSHLKGNNNE